MLKIGVIRTKNNIFRWTWVKQYTKQFFIKKWRTYWVKGKAVRYNMKGEHSRTISDLLGIKFGRVSE